MAPQEHLVLPGLASAQIVGNQRIERKLIVPKEGRVYLPLANKVGDDQEKDVEAGCLVVSELNHAVKYQMGVMVLEKVLHR